MLVHHRANDRFHSNFDWLDARGRVASAGGTRPDRRAGGDTVAPESIRGSLDQRLVPRRRDGAERLSARAEAERQNDDGAVGDQLDVDGHVENVHAVDQHAAVATFYLFIFW